METKVFISGHSQAVRIPKEYQVKDTEMSIRRVGSALILTPKHNPWAAFEESLDEFTEDFMQDGRNQPIMQERKWL